MTDDKKAIKVEFSQRWIVKDPIVIFDKPLLDAMENLSSIVSEAINDELLFSLTGQRLPKIKAPASDKNVIIIDQLPEDQDA